jgi:small subunit ribosomal protein S3
MISEVNIMGKQSTIRTIVDRNVERHLVKEFLMNNTKGAGFGSLQFERGINRDNSQPQDIITVNADRPGMVIGSKGKIIKELQRRLNEEFSLLQPKLMVEELENPTLNAQVQAEKIASAMERGWYYRRAGASSATNIMDAGARGVLITIAGKLTGSRNRTQKFLLGHVKFCGETALQHMDKGYAVAIKKLGTIGVTVEIMRAGTRLPHEITIFSEEELRIRATQEENSKEASQ